jgi:PilZ domain-containing protein
VVSLDWVQFETVKGAQVATTVVNQPRVERHERRKASRYNLFLPVVVRTARQETWSARSKDVSTRGVYLIVESDDNLLTGTELDLTLTLPKEVTGGANVLVRAHGRAVRVDKSAGQGTGDMGLAVAFETCDFIRSTSPYC